MTIGELKAESAADAKRLRHCLYFRRIVLATQWTSRRRNLPFRHEQRGTYALDQSQPGVDQKVLRLFARGCAGKAPGDPCSQRRLLLRQNLGDDQAVHEG